MSLLECPEQSCAQLIPRVTRVRKSTRPFYRALRRYKVPGDLHRRVPDAMYGCYAVKQNQVEVSVKYETLMLTVSLRSV